MARNSNKLARRIAWLSLKLRGFEGESKFIWRFLGEGLQRLPFRSLRHSRGFLQDS